jgi:hypothetical protein
VYILQGQSELHSGLLIVLYADGRRRIARRGMDPSQRLLELLVLLLRDFSTNRRRLGRSTLLEGGCFFGSGRGDTPRPEAADRPAPQRAMTRFALVRVSRNSCSSVGVMVNGHLQLGWPPCTHRHSSRGWGGVEIPPQIKFGEVETDQSPETGALS